MASGLGPQVDLQAIGLDARRLPMEIETALYHLSDDQGPGCGGESRYAWRLPIGGYRTITSARATDPEIRRVATDGGVVTALLAYLLDRHLADGALVSQQTTPFSRQALIIGDDVIVTTRNGLTLHVPFSE